MRANKMELKLEMFAFRHGKLLLRYDSTSITILLFFSHKTRREKKRVRNGSVKPHVIIIGIIICYVLWADRCRAKQNRIETKVLILFALMSDVTHNVM